MHLVLPVDICTIPWKRAGRNYLTRGIKGRNCIMHARTTAMHVHISRFPKSTYAAHSENNSDFRLD